MGDDLVQDRNKGDRLDANCCGGAAPAGADACCRRDADAKAAGRDGCGCAASSPDTYISPTKNKCC